MVREVTQFLALEGLLPGFQSTIKDVSLLADRLIPITEHFFAHLSPMDPRLLLNAPQKESAKFLRDDLKKQLLVAIKAALDDRMHE